MISGKDLKRIGFVEGKSLGLALEIVEKEYSALSGVEKLALLKHVLENPASYINDTKLSPLALALQKPGDDTIPLNIKGKSYQIYGADAIEQGALAQMETAMKLPVTVAGALMPDAHQGYGLPIGGVLATKNAVIPYGVGVDIGCRMCMTLYDLPSDTLEKKKEDFKKMLINNTKFGQATFKKPKDHAIMERRNSAS